jgi:hypothetical protein
MTPGIIFTAASGWARLKLTRRADLAADRVARPGAAELAVIETNTSELAAKLRRVLEQVFVKPGSGGLFTAAQVDDAMTRCRRMGFIVHTADSQRRRKPVMVTRQAVVETRRVPDPSMSRAELLHQLERFPDARWIGFIRADTNMSELIGGMSRIRRRTETQTQAAAEFKSLAERAMIGGGRAIDYAAPRVDTSRSAGNAVADTGEDARRRLGHLRAKLGDLAPVAERVIINGELVSEVTVSLGMGKGGAARDRVTRTVLQAADVLAVELGFVARGRRKLEGERWDDGSTLTIPAK